MGNDPQSGRVVKVALTDLRIGRRRRRLNLSKVEELAASISREGLRHPVHVAPLPEGKWRLVAGAHRVVACKRLGHAEIDAYIFDADETDREIWELEENLVRAELTPLERAEHVARLGELLGEDFGTLSPRNRRGRPPGVASSVARRWGGSKRDINRALRRAELPEAVKAEVWARPELDTSAFLDKLVRQPDEAAMHAVIDQPAHKPAGDPNDRRVERLRALLKGADDDLLARFIREGVGLARKRPRLWAEVAREFDGVAADDDEALLYRSWRRCTGKQRAWAAAEFVRWALNDPTARGLAVDAIQQVEGQREHEAAVRGERPRGPVENPPSMAGDQPDPPTDDAKVNAEYAELVEWGRRRDVLSDIPPPWAAGL